LLEDWGGELGSHLLCSRGWRLELVWRRSSRGWRLELVRRRSRTGWRLELVWRSREQGAGDVEPGQQWKDLNKETSDGIRDVDWEETNLVSRNR
jgi:hypothetical protein